MNVNMTQGLKLVGDRASAVSGAAAAIAGMSVDDNTHTFLNTDTACASQGASPHFQGNPLDGAGIGIGGAAATPYVVSHVMTLTTGQFNTFTIKRVGLHNSNAPTDAGTTLMFGIDGLSLVKQSTFSIVTTFKLSYT
jgi:hypothetical protein